MYESMLLGQFLAKFIREVDGLLVLVVRVRVPVPTSYVVRTTCAFLPVPPQLEIAGGEVVKPEKSLEIT